MLNSESLSLVYNCISFRLTGDFPDIQVIPVVNSSDVTFDVTETARGEPDMDTVALELEGVVSLPFSVGSLSVSTVSRHHHHHYHHHLATIITITVITSVNTVLVL